MYAKKKQRQQKVWDTQTTHHAFEITPLWRQQKHFHLTRRRTGSCIFHCGDHPGCSVAFVACRPYGVDNRRWLWLSAACRYLNRSPLKGIKSPVFRQFNIHCISEGQADSATLPRQTYGIRLKGSSFLRRPSSLNFLRSRYERALFKKVLPLSKSLDSVETLLPFTLRVV